MRRIPKSLMSRFTKNTVKMKKLSLILVGMIVIFLTNCASSTSKESKNGEKDSSTVVSTKTVSETSCLIGKWNFTEGGFTKSFTFSQDKTGVEVQSASDTRKFTWEMKDGGPEIIYVGEAPKWSLKLDCKKNELSVFGAVYKK